MLDRPTHTRATDDAAVSDEEMAVLDWMAKLVAGIERAGTEQTEDRTRVHGDDALPRRQDRPAAAPPVDHQIDLDCVSAWQGRNSERRRKGTGQRDTKPCPHCSVTVWIDPRVIDVDDHGAMLKCPSCRGRVPVRHDDIHRAVPAGAPPLSLSQQRRLLNRA